MYVSERIVNISDLENHISLAYTTNCMLSKELADPVPDINRIKELSRTVNRELEYANKFEFCIEQRKVILEVC